MRILALLALFLAPAGPRAQGFPPAGGLVNVQTVDKDSGFFVPAFLHIRIESPSQEKADEFTVRLFRANQDVQLVLPPKERGAFARLRVSAPGYTCEEELLLAAKQYWPLVEKAGNSKRRPVLARKTFKLKKARR